MKKLIILLQILLSSAIATAQNIFPINGIVGIGTAIPNASAALDITSANKGILIPRMTKAQRDLILSPAEGLLIFQTNNLKGFYYFTNGGWSSLTTRSWNLTGNTGTNGNIDFIGTTDLKPLVFKVNNKLSGLIDPSITTQNTSFGYETSFNNTGNSENSAFGYFAFTSNAIGNGNTAFGAEALTLNLEGNENTAIGRDALFNNTFGSSNTAAGFEALLANTLGGNNTAVGAKSLSNNIGSSENTAVGNEALFSCTSGFGNSAIGFSALRMLTTGSSNVAVGAHCMEATTTGSNNVAIGLFALLFNTTGNNNVAAGSEALEFNTTGSGNTAAGYKALYQNLTGTGNTGVGKNALLNNTIGDGNSAFGDGALIANTTGDYNTSGGWRSMNSNQTGNFNTAFGVQALHTNTTGSRNTHLGIMSLGTTTAYNNSTSIYTQGPFVTAIQPDGGNTGIAAIISSGTGNTGVGGGNASSCTNSTWINVAANFSPTEINTTAIDYLDNGADTNIVRLGRNTATSIGGQVSFSNLSDARIKTKIQQNIPGLAFIKKLKPVTYNINSSKLIALTCGNKSDTLKWVNKNLDEIRFTGFIAQQVKAAADETNFDFSGYDYSDDIAGLRYSEFVVPLAKSIQELDANMKNEMQQLEKQNASLKAEVSKRMEVLAELQKIVFSQK
ncbi:MAG: tail fiber domain-containing protein [Bacteroidetes bacterium]|nr:tail fiber domain-containing protein [Bacteroidota bacterium]